MWKRIKRAVKSNLGRLREDPLSSPSGRRDLSEITASLGVLGEQVALLERDARKLEQEEAELSTKIRKALDAGDREGATVHAGHLARVRDDRRRIAEQLERTRAMVQRARGLVPGSAVGFSGGPSADLEEVAEQTLGRLERELIEAGKLAGPGPTNDKSIAEADSGPQPNAKTIGGEALREEPDGGSPAAKTIGGGSSPQPAPATGKTIGGADPGPKAEPSPAEPKPDLVDELERLGRLRDQGVLSTEEFDAAKRKLLG